MEQPIREKLKKQSIAIELPKRRKNWRCGGLALAFSIIINTQKNNAKVAVWAKTIVTDGFSSIF